MSQLTTHILDTSLGKPASGVKIILEKSGSDNTWTFLSEGTTDSDGRVNNLLNKESVLSPGNYKLKFDTASYFSGRNVKCFYPSVEIIFEISDSTHYHVPLLLNPFGYSTYRGS
ncbi:MAG TPA: hydroxyisourate hydrolase [Bacteroidia bacterium]|nr:hydroxyisourate hydrolase [Bacteroidia bacterium]